MHKYLLKIARIVPEISSRTDRHTDTTYTDVLITILRSNNIRDHCCKEDHTLVQVCTRTSRCP